MKIVNVEQGTIEWLECRYGKIGGTLSKGLTVKSDTLMLHLIAEMLEDFEPEDTYVSSDMQRGNDLEPFARIEAEKYIGIKFIQHGWLQSEECELIGISPDGLSECETVAIEIKCPSAKKHIETVINNEIPSDNIDQCIHYFTVNPKLEKLYFISYRPENKIRPLFVKLATRETIVNIGTKAKQVNVSIDDTSKDRLKSAIELQEQIVEKIESLTF